MENMLSEETLQSNQHQTVSIKGTTHLLDIMSPIGMLNIFPGPTPITPGADDGLQSETPAASPFSIAIDPMNSMGSIVYVGAVWYES